MCLSSLHFAITVNSSYSNMNLKAKQVKCLEALYFGKDVVAVLPTGYGKSMIFHLLPTTLGTRSEERKDEPKSCCEFLRGRLHVTRLLAGTHFRPRAWSRLSREYLIAICNIVYLTHPQIISCTSWSTWLPFVAAA